MKKLLFLLALLPEAAHAALGLWGSTNDKIAQEKFFQHSNTSSTSTYSRIWDGHTVAPFAAQGQTASFEIVAYNNSGIDATNVTVQMSSLTCASGTSIANTVVASSLTVMDYTGRPIQTFSAWYVQSIGMSTFPYGRDEYEERQYPLDYRVPCTVSAGHCLPNGGTDSWANRPYGNLHVPIAWIPSEEFAASSQTIAAGQSQSFYVDVWVSTSIPAGVCAGNFTIKEGAAISTSAPVSLQVYGYKMPPLPGMTAIVYVSNADTLGRNTGNRSPTTPLTGTSLTAVNNLSKLFRAHGVTLIGDQPDASTNDYPSLEYQQHLNGSLYTAANGYANARSVGQGDPFYMIGTYTSWANNPNFSTTNANLFCTAASSWSLNMSGYSNLRGVGLYLQDEAASQMQNEIWSTWLSTKCAFSGPAINGFATGDLNIIASTAPHAAYPASTNVYGNGISNSTVTWQNNFDLYNTGTSSEVWRYNGGSQYQGAVYPYEEEGYVPEANFVGYWKKICPNGVCRGGWFGYEGNYWRNIDNGGSTCGGANASLDMNLYNYACTFGYFSSSGTALQFGANGFNYSQGDGVLSYPGKDVVFNSPSFGFLGGAAAFTLKSMRSGIDMVDHINAAYAVNSSSTMAIVQQLYTLALWEGTCTNSGDCTYSYGDRSWQYTADAWNRADERFLQIAVSGNPGPPVTPSAQTQKEYGRLIFYGRATLR